MTTLSMPASTYDELIAHLSGTDVEQVAFLFTEPPVPGEPMRVREMYRVPRESFDFQSEYHVALTDEMRGRVIQRAHELGGCLGEVHSHGGGPPVWFSGSDLRGFEEWVPHVRWRLQRRAYVALVFAGEAFDALVWEGDGTAPAPLAALEVDGRTPQSPSGVTYKRLREDDRR
jgi:hypothetical protein